MWVLVVFLGIVGSLHFIFNVSLLDKRTNVFLTSFFFSLIPLILHSFALTTNFNVISEQMSNLELTSGICAIEIALIFIATYFSKDMISGHFQKTDKLKRFLSLIPSLFFIVGILILHLWLFHTISGISYFRISLMLSVSILIIIFALVAFIQWALKDWTLRLELKTMLSSLLMMGAMVLPIFFQNISIIQIEESAFNFMEASVIFMATIAICLIGFINYKYQITKNIWNHFTKS